MAGGGRRCIHEQTARFRAVLLGLELELGHGGRLGKERQRHVQDREEVGRAGIDSGAHPRRVRVLRKDGGGRGWQQWLGEASYLLVSGCVRPCL